MNKTKTTFPILFHKGKSGKIVQWKIWTYGDTIFVEHGQVGGKLQLTPGIICEAKNVGRSNATTPEEQAISEARSMWTYQLERKYSETLADAEETVFLPMLAGKFTARKNKIKYPVSVQRKIDGLRCVASWSGNNVRLMSRGGKDLNLPHIQKELESFLPKGTVLDGELYTHGIPFQTVTSWIKKLQPESRNIQYLVYDCPEYNGTSKKWIERLEDLKSLFKMDRKNIKLLETQSADNEEEVQKLQKQFVQEGYEGAIIRVNDGKYLYGFRSNDLLKLKDFDDAEFLVISFERGVGKFENTPILVCETKEGKTFKVTPKGTQEYREQLLKNIKKYIGKQLTVRYFGVSQDLIPRFPVGVGFRESFDI
jgi:ATP-dependent DNA ligase